MRTKLAAKEAENVKLMTETAIITAGMGQVLMKLVSRVRLRRKIVQSATNIILVKKMTVTSAQANHHVFVHA